MKKITFFKENIKLLVFAAVAVGVVALAGCNDDEDDGPSQTILEIVQTTEGLDSLAKYLGLFPDIAEILQADGDKTLFAPTNTAFISLITTTTGFPPDITTVNPIIIKNVLAYHASMMRFNSSDLMPGTEIMTLAVPQDGVDEVITINQDGTLFTGSSTNKNIEIITPDIEATNGVVHTTQSVLFPLSMDGFASLLPTTFGTLSLGASFSLLAEGIEKAEVYAATNDKPSLVGILTGTEDHTVFAPTNETLDQVEGLSTFDGETWYGILANHVVLGEVSATELTSEEAISPGITKYKSALGVPLYFVFNAEGAQNGIGIFIDSDGDQEFEAEVAAPNIALPDQLTKDNGIIHIIAGVMSPPAP